MNASRTPYFSEGSSVTTSLQGAPWRGEVSARNMKWRLWNSAPANMLGEGRQPAKLFREKRSSNSQNQSKLQHASGPLIDASGHAAWSKLPRIPPQLVGRSDTPPSSCKLDVWQEPACLRPQAHCISAAPPCLLDDGAASGKHTGLESLRARLGCHAGWRCLLKQGLSTQREHSARPRAYPWPWPAAMGQKVKSFQASGSKAGGGGCQEAGRCVPGMRRLVATRLPRLSLLLLESFPQTALQKQMLETA